MAEYKKKKQQKLKSISRKSGLDSMKSGDNQIPAQGKYMRYGDFKPSDVHEGNVTYRGITYKDRPSTNRNVYSMNVKRGHNKSYFRFQGKLYKHTNRFGTAYEEVKV